MMQSSIWQMMRTRIVEELNLDKPEGSAGRGRRQIPRGDAPPPPPPPPVSLEQLLATQNDLMRRLVENDEHHGAERQQPRCQERDSSYSDFLATHPPVFADATDPLEADSWLHTTESKFGLLYCTEYQKTLYAAQQLRSAAGEWWASYIATLPEDHHVPWGEFCTAFRAHHLSADLLRSKLKEFLDLEQGNHSVFNYTRQFNTLAQYGTYHVDTDEKKANLYRAGLTIHLQERLVHLSILSYNELASAAIDQERMMKAIAEADEKKRMMPGSASSTSSSGAPPKYRMVYTPPGVSCVDHNSSRIGPIAHNSNRGNSYSNSRSSNSSSSTVPLHRHHSRLPSGHHSSFPPTTFDASTAERWATLLKNAVYPSKATRCELWHPWSISRGAIRRALHHGRLAPTIPPWSRFPREKMC
jgi:hypothetical protein